MGNAYNMVKIVTPTESKWICIDDFWPVIMVHGAKGLAKLQELDEQGLSPFEIKRRFCPDCGNYKGEEPCTCLSSQLKGGRYGKRG